VKRIVRERCAFSPDSGLTCVTSVHNIPENKRLPQDIWNQNRFCPLSGASCVDMVRAHQVHTFICYLIVRPQQKFRFFQERLLRQKWRFFKVAFS